MCVPTDRVKWWEYVVLGVIMALAMLYVTAFCEGATAPAYSAMAPPLDALPDAKPAVTVTPAVKLIAGVPYDRRLAGPQNWFRCPHCQDPEDLMFLGWHLQTVHKLAYADLDEVRYNRWPVWHDNLHNKDWKPTKAQPAVQQSGCEGGTCRQGPVRRILGRWR